MENSSSTQVLTVKQVLLSGSNPTINHIKVQCPNRALHFFLLSLPYHSPKTFFVNFLEVTKEKRIFAAIVPKEECTTFLDCWIYNLKHMETLEKMPFEAQHKIFKRLAEIADSKTLTKEEQEKYDNSMMVMWDNYAVYKHAEEKGIEKGIEKGRKEGKEEGKEEGRKEGIEEGIEKGIEKSRKELAMKLLARNTPLDDIADLTGLSIEEIKKMEQYN